MGHRQTVQPRSDATERGVWSRSPLFAYKMLLDYHNWVKRENTTKKFLNMEMDRANWSELDIPFGLSGLK